jgi:hypothetical protein
VNNLFYAEGKKKSGDEQTCCAGKAIVFCFFCTLKKYKKDTDTQRPPSNGKGKSFFLLGPNFCMYFAYAKDMQK